MWLVRKLCRGILVSLLFFLFFVWTTLRGKKKRSPERVGRWSDVLHTSYAIIRNVTIIGGVSKRTSKTHRPIPLGIACPMPKCQFVCASSKYPKRKKAEKAIYRQTIIHPAQRPRHGASTSQAAKPPSFWGGGGKGKPGVTQQPPAKAGRRAKKGTKSPHWPNNGDNSGFISQNMEC